MTITKEALTEFIASEENLPILAEVGLLTTDQHLKKLEEENSRIELNKNKALSEKKILTEKLNQYQPKMDAFEKLSRILESYEIMLDKNGEYDFSTLEDLVVKGKNGGASGNTDEIQKELAEIKRKYRDADLDIKSKNSILEKTGIELKIANEFIEKLLIEDAFRKELTKQPDIPKELHDSLIMVLTQRSGAKVEVDPDNPTNRCAVTKDGDEIPRFFELWLDSPEAKIIRKAPVSTGGGAGHLGGGGGGKAFKDMSPSERTEFFRRDPEGYRKAAAQSPK